MWKLFLKIWLLDPRYLSRKITRDPAIHINHAIKIHVLVLLHTYVIYFFCHKNVVAGGGVDELEFRAFCRSCYPT